MSNRQIMLLSSHPMVHTEMADYFKESGYALVICPDYRQALKLIYERRHRPDVVLFDVGIPEREDYELIRELREASDVHIIILSEDDRLESQLYAYSMKVDDYMVKPCPLPLVEAHVEAMLRRHNAGSVSMRSVGEITVDYDRGRVYLAGEALSLTAKEYDLLAYLVSHRGVVLSRDKILDSVWGYDYVGGYRTVDTLIKKLRAKLTSRCPYIQTIYGVGYCFDI